MTEETNKALIEGSFLTKDIYFLESAPLQRETIIPEHLRQRYEELKAEHTIATLLRKLAPPQEKEGKPLNGNTNTR